MRISYRSKLIGGFILVIAATSGVGTVMGTYLIGDRFVEQAQAKVSQDINSARMIFEHQVEKIQDAIRITANRPSIRDAVIGGKVELLALLLRAVRENEKLDILTLTDAAGRGLVYSGGVAVSGGERSENPLVAEVLRRRSSATGAVVLDALQLAREGAELAVRARIALVPTPLAKPTERREETSGMVLESAFPIYGAGEQVIGVLCGGKLLNRSDQLVDRIKDTVYRGEEYQGRKVGTVTIFLGDVRIATNVRTQGGERAIGTRVQAEVGERVLVEGRNWTERAFVVNGWYLTAYEPIRDFGGKVVGILYVGMREDRFVALRRQAVFGFLGTTFVGMGLAGVIAYILARGVLRPIRRLVRASQEISEGNFEHQVPQTSRDEIGSLERAFNQMTSAIRERDRQIRDDTEAQILRSSRLASLGQLAAGIAHEVNNPLTGVLIYLRLLQKYLSRKPFSTDRLEEMVSYLNMMEAEVSRCGRLISGMLQLGRQPAMKIESHDLNDVVDQTILLLEHRFALGNVTVLRRLAPQLPNVECDFEQIQQMLMGLFLNAFEAMPKGGVITIETGEDHLRREILIHVSDTGIGIPPENLPRLFDMFFTTKSETGMGLGLSIAQAIIRRHHGSIEVKSEVGRGSTFSIRMPVQHRPVGEAL